MSSSIVFLHIGDDVRLPTIFVRSMRRHNPAFDIIQVTDDQTPRIDGVTEVLRMQGFNRRLMTFRLQAFAELRISHPAWYFDTDMICNRPLTPPEDVRFGDGPLVAVCTREFHRETSVSTKHRPSEFPEFEGRMLGEIYPVLACATLLESSNFWEQCLKNLRTLDAKFERWFGDQEAMRNVLGEGQIAWKSLPESIYACLPEFPDSAAQAQVIHYKGPRKTLMLERASAEGLV